MVEKFASDILLLNGKKSAGGWKEIFG